jgi:hypothetical protein
MSELLTPEELSQLKNNKWLSGRWFYDPYELMQTQLNKVLKWLDEPCAEHPITRSDEDGCPKQYVIPHRRECPKCWQRVLE